MSPQNAVDVWDEASFCGVGDGAVGAARAGGWSWDFFTNFGSYMPRTHCMTTQAGGYDWPWIIALVGLTLGVIVAYAKIFIFWRRSYLAEAAEDRNHKLMELAWIFLWCAICGYAFQVLMFVWPAYRLLAVFLLVLNIWSWKFIANPEGMRVSLSAQRYRRERDEYLRDRTYQLERLVEQRTHELEEAKERAEAADKIKSMFLANMSHEIRTPLAAIMGYTDLLAEAQRDGASVAEQQDTVETIRRNSGHLLGIINDILDLSKIEAGRLSIERVRCSPAAIVREVVELLETKAQENRVRFALDLDRAGGEILSDPTRLRQIVMNLVGNAVKFTSNGTVRISAERLGTPRDPTLRLEISDEGIGMSEAEVSRLFEPFTQADSSTTRRFGGTGLGLTIAQRLAEALDGGITVRSAPGKGSTFTLTVAAVGAEAESGGESDGPQVRTGPVDLAGLRVLLVDDADDTARLHALVLSRAGADVRVCSNGEEAIARVESALRGGAGFDVVLMDVQMPVMSGLEATRLLRERGIGVPVIALTANAMREDERQCLESGCDGYLSKPVAREELIRACGRWAGSGGSRAA